MAKPAIWSYDPKSLKDAAYMAARSIEGVESAAKYVMAQDPNFVTDPADEVLPQQPTFG